MIKNEYEFTFMVGEPTIGEGIVLKLKDGRIVRTSRVVDFMIWRTGDIVIYKADDLPEQGDGEDGGVTVSVEIHDDETHSTSVSITEEAPPTAAQEDASAAK